MSGSSDGLPRNQGQGRAPVAGYRETRDKGGFQWRVRAKPGTMSGSSGGLPRNQRQRRDPVVGYRETRDSGRFQWRVTAKPGTTEGSSGGLEGNQGQWRGSVVGYCETRDKGCAPMASFCENRDKCGFQLRVTAKPGTMAGFSGVLLRHQEQRLQWRVTG
jgi:hypothetical protein